MNMQEPEEGDMKEQSPSIACPLRETSEVPRGMLNRHCGAESPIPLGA